jgi:hypothetical protein
MSVPGVLKFGEEKSFTEGNEGKEFRRRGKSLAPGRRVISEGFPVTVHGVFCLWKLCLPSRSTASEAGRRRVDWSKKKSD